MSLPVEDADELVRRRVDLDHVTQMSKRQNLINRKTNSLFLGFHMVVPDSITVGPSRTNFERLPQDDDRLPVRMEVPDRIRPGKDRDKFVDLTDDLTNFQETMKV